MKKLPRNKENDHTREMAETRRGVVTEATGVPLGHIGAFSFDPAILRGNMESFCGVAQVPLGFAGPLLVDGEHAHGEFYVPMATTEGTLIASYNRGMRLTREAGGVRTTVINDAMQHRYLSCATRAPHARSVNGSRGASPRSRPRPRRRLITESSATSNSTPSGSFAGCASTSPPATPLVRTWSPRPPGMPASG